MSIGKGRKENQENKILIRIARIAVGAAVKWKRKLTDKISKGGNKEEEHNHAEEEARYKTRLLACTKRGATQETNGMQLTISAGFRAIHCKNCGKQERVLRNRCCCDAIWHQCPIHRIDPPYHASRKGRERKENGEEKTGKKVRP